MRRPNRFDCASQKSIFEWFTDRVTTRPRVSIVLLAAGVAVGTFAFEVGCTTKIVGTKGIYSPQQLPKERKTPVLDTIDEMLAGDESQ